MLLLAVSGCCGLFLENDDLPPGDHERFDVLGEIPAVIVHAAPGVRLEEIRAVGVRSDGTVDLTAASKTVPAVEYAFLVDVPAPRTPLRSAPEARRTASTTTPSRWI